MIIKHPPGPPMTLGCRLKTLTDDRINADCSVFIVRQCMAARCTLNAPDMRAPHRAVVPHGKLPSVKKREHKLNRTIYSFAAFLLHIICVMGWRWRQKQCFRMIIVAYTQPASPWPSNPIRRTHGPAGSLWPRTAKTLLKVPVLKGVSGNWERRA
jgi:hypothetical protein